MKDKRISEKEFGLNLNLDDSTKILSFGDSRYILNCWSGINREGSIGAVENEKGNYKIEFTLPDGQNTCIGSAQDQQNDAIIFCMQNTQGKHGIYRYNIGEETVDKILVNSQLNFNRQGRKGYIWSANVIDGIFTWCTGLDEAGKINIEGARIWSTRGGSPTFGDHYQEMNRQALVAIKAPPKLAPEMSYWTDVNKLTNFVANKSFQFAYRYVYEDFEKSVFSPLSTTAYQPFDYTLADDYIRSARAIEFKTQVLPVDTLFAANQNAYNAIRVVLQLGDRNVKYIEVAVRDSDLDAWNIFETLDNRGLLSTASPTGPYLAPGQDWIVNFYNERTGITVSDDAVLKSQDYFPINPKHQEYTHLNLLTYANFLDGFDLEPINASVSINANEFKAYVYNQPTSSTGAGIRFILGNSHMEWEAPAPSSLREGDIIKCVNVSNRPVAYYRVSDADLNRSQANWEDYLVNAFKEQGVTAQVDAFQMSFLSFTLTPGHRLLTFGARPLGTDSDILVLQLHDENHWTKPTLKSGAFHQWAFIYYDEFGRHGPAQTNDTLKKYVNMWGEQGEPPSGFGNAYYYTADITISHTPPIWAHSYQLVYTGAIKIQDFIQYYYRGVRDAKLDHVFGVFSFKDWVYHQTSHPRVSKSYSFEVGDFIREVKSGGFDRNTSTSHGNYDLAHLADDNRSSRITKIGYDVSDELTDELAQTPNSLGRIGQFGGLRSLIEQFKYTQESEEQIYHEIGQAYLIKHPGKANRFHSGNTQDQTFNQPAIIHFERGDAWTKMRPYEQVSAVTGPDDTPSAWIREKRNGKYMAATIEDPEYSDYFPSASKGFGRPFGENLDYKRTNETNGVRYTGTYLEGTKTNNLNSVDFDSVGYVDIRHGEINSIREVGFTLKVLQEHKVTSIYLGRQVTTNPQGTQDIILSDRVLSSFNPSELDYGCSHAESVVKHDRHLYFFDAAYGKVIRDSANGMEPISDSKVSSLFKNLGEDIQKVSKDFSFVRGGWNDETNSYILTYMNQIPNVFYDDVVPPIGGNPKGKMDSFTISFQELVNKWKSFHSFIPDHMEFLGREFVSWTLDGLWRHNQNEIRCNYYGNQEVAVLTPISNISADAVKAFQAIALQANKSPKLIEISIPPNELFPEGMESRLQGANLRWIEGNLYGALKKDLNTPGMNGASDVKKLNNGREMRGNVCEFKIIFDDTDQVIVTRVIIEADHSLISG